MRYFILKINWTLATSMSSICQKIEQGGAELTPASGKLLKWTTAVRLRFDIRAVADHMEHVVASMPGEM